MGNVNGRGKSRWRRMAAVSTMAAAAAAVGGQALTGCGGTQAPDGIQAQASAGEEAHQLAQDDSVAVPAVEQGGQVGAASGPDRAAGPVPEFEAAAEWPAAATPSIPSAGAGDDDPLDTPLQPVVPGDPESLEQPEDDGVVRRYSEQGAEYTWHDGDRVLTIRVQSDLEAAGDGTIAVRSADASGASDASPVFLADSGELMSLPGGVLVALDPDWDAAAVEAFFAANGVSSDQRSELEWLPNGFLVETDPGFASLELANALAGQDGVDISSPNWLRDLGSD